MRIITKQGLAPLAAIIIGLIVLGGGGYAIKKSADGKKEKKAKEEQAVAVAKEAEKEALEKRLEAAIGTSVHIKLDEQNKSGQKGEVTITQTGTSTVKVIVSITGKPSSVSQPAHIHVGACPNPGAVKYPLTNVEKGASQTDLPLTLAQLLSELPLAINVHKSAAEASVYTSCGNIASGTQANAEASGKETKVSYTSAGFSPKTVTIKKGETVVFDNKTGKAASVASDEHPTHLLYPEFDQYKTAQRGKTEFRFTFTKSGTWNYHDHLNAGMVGTVVVTE